MNGLKAKLKSLFENYSIRCKCRPTNSTVYKAIIHFFIVCLQVQSGRPIHSMVSVFVLCEIVFYGNQHTYISIMHGDGDCDSVLKLIVHIVCT